MASLQRAVVIFDMDAIFSAVFMVSSSKVSTGNTLLTRPATKLFAK